MRREKQRSDAVCPLRVAEKKNLDHSVRQMGEKVMPVGEPSAFCVPVVSLDGKFQDVATVLCVCVFGFNIGCKGCTISSEKEYYLTPYTNLN